MKFKYSCILLGLLACLILSGCPNELTSTQDPGEQEGSNQDQESQTPVALTLTQQRQMVPVQGGTFNQVDLFNNTGFNHTLSNFSIGKYEVTYELWYTVRQWALQNGYTIPSTGREGTWGSDGQVPTNLEPVTRITWRECIIWCNAYSEWDGKQPVYTSNGLEQKLRIFWAYMT